MRKLATLAWSLTAACTLSACGLIPPAPSFPDAFTDVSKLAVAVSEQSAKKHSAHFTITGSAAHQNFNGSGDIRLDASDVAMNLTMTIPEGRIGMVLLGNAIYIRMPPGREVAPGKPWFKITSDANDPVSKVFGAVVTNTKQSADIKTALDEMKAAGSITRFVHEKLDGKDVWHYWFTIDTATLAQSFAQSVADPTLKDALLKEAAKGAKTIDEEAWFTMDNLPVKETAEVPESDGTTTSITVTYSDWGKPVNITAPPDSEIGTLPTLAG